MRKRLQDLHGQQFESQYLQASVDSHEQALALLDTQLSSEPGSSDLGKELQRARDTIAEHLNTPRRCAPIRASPTDHSSPDNASMRQPANRAKRRRRSRLTSCPTWEIAMGEPRDANRQPTDMHNVSINEEWELQYWARELGMSEDDLKRAVQEVGNVTNRLRDYRPPH